MKKMILGFGTLIFIGVLVIGATAAFFSDTETSRGNVFAAGEIDLYVGNDSYLVRNGLVEIREENSWEIQSDIAGDDRLFFSFSDVKPGDLGEDTISLRVDSNNAWACMNAEIVNATSGGHPEAVNEDGHLQDEIEFAFWVDDGDNVYEEGEVIFATGTAAELFNGAWQTLADSGSAVFDPEDLGEYGELIGGEEYHIAKAWCHGNLEPNPASPGEGSPADRKETGFTCNGAPVTNASQGDQFEVDIEFYAEQSRNNLDFSCQALDDEEEEGIRAQSLNNWPTVHELGIQEMERWKAEGRYGDGGGAQTWELGVGNDTQDPNEFEETDFSWDNGTAVSYSVDYDGNTATFTVGGTSVTYSVGSVDPTDDLYFVARGTDEIGSVELSNLQIDGISVTPSTVSSVDGPESLKVSGVDLSNGFEATGMVKFDWSSGPSHSQLAFQVVVGN